MQVEEEGGDTLFCRRQRGGNEYSDMIDVNDVSAREVLQSDDDDNIKHACFNMVSHDGHWKTKQNMIRQ